jgi:hypothetical protein
MLCFRCEHRAKYLEKKIKDKDASAPRAECYMAESCVMGCYMFQPVKPITIRPRKGDKRPMTLNIISCRVERSEDVELNLRLVDCENKYLLYWVPL